MMGPGEYSVTLRRVWAVMALGCTILCTGILHAQAFRASIIGRVTDSTDAAIPGARVKIVRTETNESAETTSDAFGSYSFAFLSPGRYRLTATAPGFRTLEQNGILLDSNETRDLAVTLLVGDVKDRQRNLLVGRVNECAVTVVVVGVFLARVIHGRGVGCSGGHIGKTSVCM